MRFESSFAFGEELLRRVENASCRELGHAKVENWSSSGHYRCVQARSGTGFRGRDTRLMGVLAGTLVSPEWDSDHEVSMKALCLAASQRIC